MTPMQRIRLAVVVICGIFVGVGLLALILSIRAFLDAALGLGPFDRGLYWVKVLVVCALGAGVLLAHIAHVERKRKQPWTPPSSSDSSRS